MLEDLHTVWNNTSYALELVNTVCLRPMYQCPGQARFFRDPGSLINFFEPDMVDHGIMVHKGYLPYSLTAVWQRQGPDCDYNCTSADSLLLEGLPDICSVGMTLALGPFVMGVIGHIEVGALQQQ